MNVHAWPALAAVLGIAAMSGGMAAAQQRPAAVEVPLAATPQNAGKIAVATLMPTGPATTQVMLLVSGLPSETARPATMYSYIYPGTCANLGPKPAFDLNQHVLLDETRPMQIWKSVPAAMSALRSGNYAIVLRASPADGFSNLFCGDLGHSA
ncbi:hypothetical protein C7401_114138 [Paraburkholderia unamae]|uniref:hypothetical protein n=1 Tax=Paraburkholderia unamae TaxID=219649 RepID=UPI000DC30A4C|nr:hypothetical protein [Paraburkholderia unamae]RAR57919.1 hypothetical protein C7401_114138 [Paraburkholderia unamae]